MSSLPSAHALKLLLLGGFDARLNDHPVTGISYNKMRALLAYLAVEREQDHKREVLADLLWSGNDSTTARGNLRRTLSDLRRVLELPAGTVMFSASKHAIRFIPNAYIDAMDFLGQTPEPPDNREAARSAEERIIALYRGEFLAGLSVPDSPYFEDWLQIQRETMHRRALALLEQLSNRHMQIGDYSKALQFALRHTELEPWDEDAHRRAMRLYALNGQNRAAIVQYDACCRLLKKELGTLPSEETRHLADRIRNGGFVRGASQPLDVPLPQTIAQPPAERRQVTVLYCELTPAAMDDPDEAMTLLHAPQVRCVEIIRRFAGHIVQTHGGGLLAYFGYPQAHEDAARRAVQAALAVTREAAHGIDIRACVHTGLIITGGDASMPDTVGKTSKLAIQLRHSAAHDDVAISRETHRIVSGYFDCISLGVQSLPGSALPLEIFKVVRESGARTRLDAAAQLTPLAGRKAEIAALAALWEKSAQGARHVVLIQGEAGMGKSRLLHTLKDRLAGTPHAVRELRCFPEFCQSPFHPLIAMLETTFGVEHGDTPETKFGRLATYLETHYAASAHVAVPLLTQLLSLPLGGHYQAPVFSPQKQKEQTIAILLGLLQALTVQQPVLFIVEDLHWVDPSSLELLTLFIAQQTKEPILTALTARPEFVPPWSEGIQSTLALAPLIEQEVTELLTSLREDIPAATIRRIVERADGVPLFVEEMMKIADMDIHASIPTTLHDLLAARMDKMGKAKYTAQLAATFGREFDLDLLRKIFPHGTAALMHTLNALQDAGLILKVSESTCQFKHALIQEAAYQSQTRSARQTAHQRIAQALQSDFPDIVATRPELLAQHLSAGGETRQAIQYWIKAGQRAALHSANTEAIEHFNGGLQLLMTLPPDKECAHLEFALRVNLGATLSATRGYGSLDAGAEYARALELGEELGDGPGLFKAMWGMWLGSSSRVGHLHALELAEKLLRLAQQDSDPVQHQQAHYAMGNSLLWTGRLDEARIHQERAMALYQPSQHDIMVSELGENICVSTGSQLAWVLWLQGFPDQARAIGERTLTLARQVNHPYSLCYATAHVMILNRWLRQIGTTRQLAQETMLLADQHGFPLWLLSGMVFHGWAMSVQGHASEIAQMRQGVDIVRAAMSGIEAFFLAPLGEAYMHSGQPAEALSAANATLDVVQARDDRFLESEILRFKGECLLEISASGMQEAEECFSHALAISRRQGAKSLELRTAMSMARLCLRQDKPDDVRRVLGEIYGWFTEGFDTPDLEEARRLLEAGAPAK